jgi:hypothetical protein
LITRPPFYAVSPHVDLACVRAPADDLRRRHAGGGMVHLVLHGGEKPLRFLLALVVVAGQREDLPDALVNARFTGANLSDAGKQFVEIVHQPAAALEPFVIERESFDDVFAKAGRGPRRRLYHVVADVLSHLVFREAC